MNRTRTAERLRLTLSGVLLALLSMACGVALERSVLSDAAAASSGTIPAAAKGDFRLMAEAWNLIHHRYVDRSAVTGTNLTYGAISGMVDALGDTGHSAFLTPEAVKQDRDMMRGEFAGVGAEIQIKDNRVVVVAPMDGSPAQRAGLAPGDVILRVDGKDVTGVPLVKVADRIRGPAGSKVTLDIREARSAKVRSVTLVRAHIALVSVRWHILPGTHIAHVRLSEFSKGTARDLDRTLAAARAHGAGALILDLRNNPGGLLSEAVAVASRFLDHGNVLIEKNARGDRHAVPVQSDVTRWTLPMVLLVNAGTASAAEIVSGALEDAHRATVIGEKTFGTGTVLQQFPLSDGSAVLLAIEEWLTPDGKAIWHKGIEPDVTVALDSKAAPLLPSQEKHMSAAGLEASGDAQLLRARDLLLGRREAAAGGGASRSG